MAALGLCCCSRLSLAGVSRLLIVAASLDAEHGLQASVVVAHGLSFPTARGIILDQ